MKNQHSQLSINGIALGLLLTASLAQAQVTLDSFTGAQVNYSTPTVGGPLTWSHTVGGGSDGALVVAISFEDANEATTVVPGGVSFGLQSLTLLGSIRMATGTAGPGGFDNQVSLWYLANPTAGTASITVASLTLDAANNNVKGFAGSFFGVGGYTGLTTASGATSSSLSFSGLNAGSAVFASANNSAGTTTFTSGDLTTPLAVLAGGGSTSQGGYALNLSGIATATLTAGGGARTPMIGVALTPIPEPSTMALAMLGLGGFALLRKRK